MASEAKRQRKPNFSKRESLKLLELVSHHYNTLHERCNKSETNRKKMSCWEAIALQVSQVCLIQRDQEECRKKWRDFKGHATAHYVNSKGTSDDPETQPPFYELILKIMENKDTLDIDPAFKSESVEADPVPSVTSGGDGLQRLAPPTAIIPNPYTAKKAKRKAWAATLPTKTRSDNGDPALWDEMLKSQIEYYKAKTELIKEQLSQLQANRNSN